MFSKIHDLTMKYAVLTTHTLPPGATQGGMGVASMSHVRKQGVIPSQPMYLIRQYTADYAHTHARAHARAHTHTTTTTNPHARTHARTHAHTHARTQTHTIFASRFRFLAVCLVMPLVIVAVIECCERTDILLKKSTHICLLAGLPSDARMY